jgi:hypothetical protein
LPVPTEALSSTAPPDTPTTAPVISTEFTPTDPATVSLAAGRPQLVEFFAYW